MPLNFLDRDVIEQMDDLVSEITHGVGCPGRIRVVRAEILIHLAKWNAMMAGEGQEAEHSTGRTNEKATNGTAT